MKKSDKKEEHVKKLLQKISDLYIMVDIFDGVPCSKCGAYHSRGHVCYRCRHDDSVKVEDG